MSLTNLYPSLRPSLLLDFANAQALDPRISFTRASIATRVNPRGQIEVVPAGVPRFDFDPVTLACKGLLVEEAATNNALYSEDCTNAAWLKSQVSVTARTATTGDKVVENAASAAHTLYQTSTAIPPSAASTFYVDVQAAERSAILLAIYDNAATSNNVTASFDLAAGTVSIAAANNGLGSGAQASIHSLGGGVYRCRISGTPSTGGTTTRFAVGLRNAPTGSATYLGDGVSGLFVWRSHFQAGDIPMSYIPTTSAAVTRAADVAVMTGTNFSAWHRADEGSFFADFSLGFEPPLSYEYALAATGASATELIGICTTFGATSPTPGGRILDANVAQATFRLGSQPMANKRSRAALAYRANDFAFCLDGSAAATDTSGTVPAVNQLFVGAVSGGAGAQSNAHIRRLAYYPQRLSNAELQALTSPA